MGNAASATEDYLKVIYGHTEWQPEPITPTGLATRLGLAPSSVTEMVKKLVVNGLVSHQPYGLIELTPDGTAAALRMVRRHRVIETWLVERMGYSWDRVHEEAEVLEHAMSDHLLDAIDDQLGRPVRDPHGDPIPTRDGVVTRPAVRLLGDLAPGEHGVIARISDRDPVLLRHLASDGIRLDVAVTRTNTGASLGQAVLPRDALTSVWVAAP